MKFISTRDPTLVASFHDALFMGLASDGGLYIPADIPELDLHTMLHDPDLTLPSLAQYLMTPFLQDIPAVDLKQLVTRALDFPIPLVQLESNLYLLEVFHGPTLAFKDVGARFMAQIMGYYLAAKNKRITLIVATSGDTGSAIATAFHGQSHIDVFVLYPSHKVSLLQEMQMTTLGGNVHAIEVQGTFDDCQKMVKTALLDAGLREKLQITTANSINISRLLPQMIFHAWGLCQLARLDEREPVLSIPSGNFGNLVSAIYAKQMGFGVDHFIAATNANAVVPDYLKTGIYSPKVSIPTFSNAMDVGHPSNFERLLACFHGDHAAMAKDISGVSVSNQATLDEIRHTYERSGYILDPHTAVGVSAIRQAGKWSKRRAPFIVTATAHPAKFPEVVREAIGVTPAVPVQLQSALAGVKQSTLIKPDFEAFRCLLDSGR